MPRMVAIEQRNALDLAAGGCSLRWGRRALARRRLKALNIELLIRPIDSDGNESLCVLVLALGLNDRKSLPGKSLICTTASSLPY